MARNVEIKCRIESVDVLMPVVRRMADAGPVEISQDDTFFRCDAGRLKLRDFGNGTGELIFYRRADEPGPKVSHYGRSPTSSPGTLRETLSAAFGQAGRVIKRRWLFHVGRTRVHLDEVEALGQFLELEVVLEDGESPQKGVQEAHELMDRLGLGVAQLVDRAYVDLLAERE
jgi:adenylate cyclase class IV